MRQAKQGAGDSAFTLVETMVVVAIIGVLAAVAMLSYAHFTKKSQSVEADIAVAEVARLEEVYFSSTGTYSSDLDAIGFKPDPPLQYNRISVQAVNGPEGSMFQVIANPLSGGDASQARSLTRYASNQGDGNKSTGGGSSGGAGRTSTVTSIGNTGSGQSVGGGEQDELSEQWVELSPLVAKVE
jgi:type IV pilus assembly protein PilE